jgi:glycopeptide antibiotics resistance protein
LTASPPQQRTTPWYVTALRCCGVALAVAALVAFFYQAARLTLSPVEDAGQAGGNTDPGKSLHFYLDQPTKQTFIQLGGNLILLAPLGVLVPIISTRLRGPVRLALLGAMVSLSIETIQGYLVEGRAFDIDDVILNTAGVVLAYLLIGRPMSRAVRGRAG